jgi:PPM family protein phosphatase
MTSARPDLNLAAAPSDSRRNAPISVDQKHLDFSIFSDAGRVRHNNEDCAAAAPEINLYVLCDGMGGLEAGERASQLAVETVLQQSRAAATTASPSADLLAATVESANAKIHKAARDAGSKSGMGSTIVAIQFHGDRAFVAHVGDSRIYRLRRGDFAQITEDHSFVAEQVRRGILTQEEADRSQLQNVLIRALGVEPSVKVDTAEELVLEGDTFLLCSDGLTRELSDEQIAGVLEESGSANEAAARLVRLANQAGGGDNVTVIVIRNTKRHQRVRSKIGRWFKSSEESA